MFQAKVEIEGKPIGNDIRQGIYTLPLLYALEDKKVCPQIKNLLYKKADITNEEISKVIQLVRQTKALEKTKKLKEKFIKKAIVTIEKLSNNKYKNISMDLLKLL